MPILDALTNPKLLNFLGYAGSQFGALGNPERQDQIRDRFLGGLEQKRREKQFGGLLNSPDLNEQQRGILQFLGPEQSGPLLAQQAFSQPNVPKPTSLMQNLEAAGMQPGTEEYNAAMRSVLMKPQVQIDQGPKLPTGYQWKNPSDPSQGVVAIPGGPHDPASPSRKRSKEEAATISAARNSKQEIEQVQSKLFSADGRLNRGELAEAMLPWSSGRTTRQRVKRAIESVIRAQSGAAVPEQELERYMDMYFPKIGDSDEAAKAKMEALENFVSGLLGELGAGGQQTGDYSQEDLEFTAKKHGISVEEVKRRLNNAP